MNHNPHVYNCEFSKTETALWIALIIMLFHFYEYNDLQKTTNLIYTYVQQSLNDNSSQTIILYIQNLTSNYLHIVLQHRI